MLFSISEESHIKLFLNSYLTDGTMLNGGNLAKFGLNGWIANVCMGPEAAISNILKGQSLHPKFLLL